MSHRAHHAWGDEIGWCRSPPEGFVPCDVNEATIVWLEVGRGLQTKSFTFTEAERPLCRNFVKALDITFEAGERAAPRHVRETLGIREGR